MSVPQSGRQVPEGRLGAPPDYRQLRQSPQMRPGIYGSGTDRMTLGPPDGAGRLPLRPGMPPPSQFESPQFRPQHLPLRPGMPPPSQYDIDIPQRPQNLPLRPGVSQPRQVEVPQRQQIRSYPQGILSHGPTPSLDPGFKIRKASFFTVGRVFRMLWIEPATASSNSEHTYPAAYGQRVVAKVRIFVVIRTSDKYSTCVPIHTYSGRGDKKPGINCKEHCVVYTGSKPPINREASRESLPPIRVDPDDRQALLDDASLINFGRLCTVEHNIKVKAFGIVNRSDIETLFRSFKRVYFSPPQNPDQAKSAYQLKPQPEVGNVKALEDPDDSDDEEADDDDDEPDDDEDDYDDDDDDDDDDE